MRGMACIAMMLILPFDGCALETLIFGDIDAVPADTHYARYGYPTYVRSASNQWVGKSREELLEALGPPDAVFEARPKTVDYWEAGTPCYMYVYGGADKTSRQCIDTYVVAESSSTVIKYYCR